MPPAHNPLIHSRQPRARLPAGLLAGLGLLAGVTHAAAPGLPTVTLELGPHRLQAEIAADDASRQRGLMGRTRLGENEAMLFVFRQPGMHCMWMKNTPLPLAVAFLDDERRILNLAEMSPLSEALHCAEGPARYALETNRGWFTRRGIVAGDRMHSQAPLPSPR